VNSPSLWVLECLTPVHVGSGEELARDLDYYCHGTTTEIIDWEKMVSHPAAQSLADWIVNRFMRQGGQGGKASIEQFLRDHHIDSDAIRSRQVSGAVEASRIRLAIRAADGRPIIPGSALKGAIRTLLLTGLAAAPKEPHQSRNDHAKRGLEEAIASRKSPKFRAQPLEQAIFRRALRPEIVPSHSKLRNDPKGDLLRMLKITDAFFPSEKLDVLSTKALGTNRNTLTAVEALVVGARALVSLQLRDQFLEQRLFSDSLPDLETLARWSREHARHLLDGDMEFFKRVNGGARADRTLLEGCEELRDLIAKSETNAREAIFLRLGWGTGWRTMTGDLLSREQRQALYGKGGQTARYVGCDKTRKVILDGHSANGAPRSLLGWVCIRPPAGDDEMRALAKQTRAPALAPRPAPQSVSAPQSAPIPPASDSLLKRIEALRPSDRGRVQALADDIAHAEPQRREQLIESFEARLKQVFGKQRRKEIEQIMAKLRARSQ